MTLYQLPFKMYPGSQTNLGGRKGLWGEGAAGVVVRVGFFLLGQWFKEIIPSGSILTQISGILHFLWGVYLGLDFKNTTA